MKTEATKRQYAELLSDYKKHKDLDMAAARAGHWDVAEKHWKKCEEIRAKMQEMVDSKQV